jgi:hypothetical protein
MAEEMRNRRAATRPIVRDMGGVYELPGFSF